MSRELTEQFTQLLFDKDLIGGARNQSNGATSVFAHYPNGSTLTVQGVEPNLVRLELELNGKKQLTTCAISEALEYVKRWSLDLKGREVFVTTLDEAYSAARDLLEGIGDLEGVDTSAVDVEKLTLYITYPRVGNYSGIGLLVKLPDDRSRLSEILEACTDED